MNKELDYPTILDVVQRFYAKATTDVWIAFIFKVIDDFDSHIPRIADFWQLQLTGKMQHPASLPFNLLDVHLPLKLTDGHINRWVVLFHETLAETDISEEIIIEWKRKVELFRSRIAMLSRLSCS